MSTFAPRLVNATLALNDTNYTIRHANHDDVRAVSFFNPSTQHYLRHYAGLLIETDPSVNPEFFPQDSSFVPERGEGGYVFRCINPGMEDYHICQGKNDPRHTSGLVVSDRLEPCRFAIAENALPGDAVVLLGREYLLTAANNQDTEAVSLRDPLSGRCLRHMEGRVRLSTASLNAEFFAADSSFKMEHGEGCFYLRCCNAGMDRYYVALDDDGQLIVSRERKPYPVVLKSDLNVCRKQDNGLSLRELVNRQTSRITGTLNRNLDRKTETISTSLNTKNALENKILGRMGGLLRQRRSF